MSSRPRTGQKTRRPSHPNASTDSAAGDGGEEVVEEPVLGEVAGEGPVTAQVARVGDPPDEREVELLAEPGNRPAVQRQGDAEHQERRKDEVARARPGPQLLASRNICHRAGL